MMRKDKKGSHVGVILSFLIFVTFLAFLYSVIEPVTRIERGKMDLLDYLKTELQNEFSEDISTVTVSINNVGDASCIMLPRLDPALENIGAIVKYANSSLIDSYIESDGKLSIDTHEEAILKIYYSKEFKHGESLECDLLSDDDYEIQLFRTEKDIFESKIKNITEQINTDHYEEIKEKLNVPVGDEFGFTFLDENKNFVAGTIEKNVSASVYSEEVPIQYIDSEANIKPGFLRLRVW